MSRWWTVLLLTLFVPVAQAATPWHADAGSELRFRATQAGARFEGRFASFDASIVFDERDLAGCRFDVTITLASADTRDADRDGVLKGLDLTGTVALARATRIPVIASGGLAGMADIEALLAPEHALLEGAITGRALYDGRLDAEAALALIRERRRQG